MHTTHTHTHTPLHSLRTSVYTLCYAIGRRGLYTHHQHGSVWRRIHKSHSSMRKFHEGNDPTYCPTSSTLPPLALYGTPHKLLCTLTLYSEMCTIFIHHLSVQIHTGGMQATSAPHLYMRIPQQLLLKIQSVYMYMSICT